MFPHARRCIRYVIVNGTIALRDGKQTGAHGGRVLRRTKYMPSRPMPGQGERRITARGVVATPGQTDPLQVTIDITQGPAARSAVGTFRITNAKREVVLDAHELGLMQTSNGWGSFTARARVNLARDAGSSASGLQSGGFDFAQARAEGSEYRHVTVVVERADPWLPDRAASITIAVEGLFQATGRGSVRIDAR